MRLARRLALLLAQEAQRRRHLRARRVRVDLDVVADRVGREQADDRAHLQPALRDELLQHAPRIGVQVARRLADDRVRQHVRELAGELPRVEERHPVDVAEQLVERIVVEALHARHAAAPAARDAPSRCGGDSRAPARC